MKSFLKSFYLPALVLMSILVFTQCSVNEVDPPFDCTNSDLAATATATPSACGDATSTIEVTATGGDGPYMYKLDEGTPQASNVFENVEPGLYQVIVTDANECIEAIAQVVMSTTSYANDIAPIMMNSCATTGCHDGSTSLPDFRSLAVVQANAGAIKSVTQSGFMPRNSTLPQSEIDLIACWVNDGALDN